MKEFNITGTCFPDRHYMVDIGDRLAATKALVDKGKYFCINRGRQYWKSTTLEALLTYLEKEYFVISLSFEGLGEAAFEGDSAMVQTFAARLRDQIEEGLIEDPEGKFLSVVKPLADKSEDEREAMAKCSLMIGNLCRASDKPIVLLIDEVDQAGNHDAFIHLLGMLRDRYLKRNRLATFQSVILAGVYDVRNLKLKIRSEDEHQYNSPWNIAAPYDFDMSLSEAGIAGMLEEYERDHNTGMDIAMIAKLVREYTGGYPYLVSRLCMIMDSSCWNREGFLAAVKKLLGEENTLFDDLVKKLDQFPALTDMLRQVLYHGKKISYNYSDREMALATRFGYIASGAGQVRIANRIFETFLYNYFVTESEKKEILYDRAADSKSMFILPDGSLDMPLILKRFTETFNEIYGDRDERFLEAEGRRYFMLYVRPIINGVGNYYIEAETRDGTRTDMVIDYRGKRYIIEMKIWRDESYNERGEKQLAEYLDYFRLDTGYMVSFCFNKNKVQGLKAPVKIGDRNLIETVV